MGAHTHTNLYNMVDAGGSRCLLQGASWQSGYFKLALMGRNIQVRFGLKVVLESWDWIDLGIATNYVWFIEAQNQEKIFTNQIKSSKNQMKLRLTYISQKLVVMPKNIQSQDSKTTFKQNLACIFLSVRANLLI